MKNCNNCGENNWGNFKEVDGYIIAICQECGNEVEFLSRKSKKQQERIKPPEYQIAEIAEKLDKIVSCLEKLIEII